MAAELTTVTETVWPAKPEMFTKKYADLGLDNLLALSLYFASSSR